MNTAKRIDQCLTAIPEVAAAVGGGEAGAALSFGAALSDDPLAGLAVSVGHSVGSEASHITKGKEERNHTSDEEATPERREPCYFGADRHQLLDRYLVCTALRRRKG